MLEIQAKSVAEFLRCLLPTEAHFVRGTRYYYRGQADAQWGLVPSIRRKESWKRFGGAENHGLRCDNDVVISSEDELAWAENTLLTTTKRIIRQRGLSPTLEETPALVAFAQHIGLPTRALDWSRSPLTAAYFAAAPALAFAERRGSLAVFAMSDLYIEESHHMAGVEPIFPTGFGNATLVSQQGLLLVVPRDRGDLLAGTPVRKGPFGTLPLDAHVDDQLVKLTLAHEHVGDLMEILRDQDIHGASIFPDTRGIAELVREVYLTAPPDVR
jgi:hypothetical protein